MRYICIPDEGHAVWHTEERVELAEPAVEHGHERTHETVVAPLADADAELAAYLAALYDQHNAAIVADYTDTETGELNADIRLVECSVAFEGAPEPGADVRGIANYLVDGEQKQYRFNLKLGVFRHT